MILYIPQEIKKWKRKNCVQWNFYLINDLHSWNPKRREGEMRKREHNKTKEKERKEKAVKKKRKKKCSSVLYLKKWRNGRRKKCTVEFLPQN